MLPRKSPWITCFSLEGATYRARHADFKVARTHRKIKGTKIFYGLWVPREESLGPCRPTGHTSDTFAGDRKIAEQGCVPHD